MITLTLITDSYPQANGAGISQTLYNLFSGYEGGLVLLLGESEKLPDTEQRLPAKLVRYEDQKWRGFSRRPFSWSNAVIRQLRMRWMQSQQLCGTCLPPHQNSVVLVSTTVPEKLLLAWRLQQEYGYTVIPYFMDDWLANNLLSWKGGNIQQVACDLLANAPAWLMISHNLKQVLMQRYQLDEKPCLVVHNPAPPVDSGLLTVDRFADDADRHPSSVHSQLIIYAGSIWPMHADALIAVAKAMHLLHSQGQTKYCLRLYVPESQWQQYKTQLQGLGVEYAGWVPYAKLQEVLQPAWLTLCTASFLPAHQPFSYSSVQTKLTDYMAAGKPVLQVGPADGASGQFVAQQGVGYSCPSADATSIAQALQAIAVDKMGYAEKSKQSQLLAATVFSQQQVQEQLYAFFQTHATPQPQP